MTNREKESMLAYTERMRKLATTRNNPERQLESPDSIPLVVRAKHIPKFPVLKTNRRRPASLDELIGRSQAERSKHRKEKPKSASRLSLPSLPEKYAKNTHHVRISFVSASDLYDIVDFSIRNKSNKQETLQFLQMENEVRNKAPDLFYKPRPVFTGQRDSFDNKDTDRSNARLSSGHELNFNIYEALPPIDFKENDSDNDRFDKESSSISPEVNVGNMNNSQARALKKRPNRAKRMQINKPDLDAIPENDIALQRRSGKTDRNLSSPPPKQSPRNFMPLQSHLMSIPENELNEDKSGERKKYYKSKGHNIHAMVRLEPFGQQQDRKLYKDGEENVDQHLKVKLKAQKRFRKLIFLRDVPDRNNRI